MAWDNHRRTEDNPAGKTQEQPPAEAVDTEALETVRVESRKVLSEQIRLLNDIDDKAMRSVRTAVLFIGLVVTAVQISDDPTAFAELDAWPFRLAVGGVSFLLTSVLLGIYTYSVSEPEFGVSDGHRNDVVQGGFSRHEWLVFQLNEYDEWTDSMSEVNEQNATLLHGTLVATVLGVVSLLCSIALTAEIPYERLAPPVIAAALLVLVPTVVLSLATPDS